MKKITSATCWPDGSGPEVVDYAQVRAGKRRLKETGEMAFMVGNDHGMNKEIVKKVYCSPSLFFSHRDLFFGPRNPGRGCDSRVAVTRNARERIQLDWPVMHPRGS